MIICKNVSYTYDSKKKVVKNVNMKLSSGKTGVLLGVAGSGKSTLLKCIGKNIVDYKGNIRTSDNCRYINHLPSFSDNFTGIEYVEMLLSLSDNKTNELVNNVIDSIGVRKDLNKSIKIISSYTRKVLILLSTLCLDKEIILIDEPFKGLDHKSQLLVLELIKLLKSKGKTILFSTSLFYYGFYLADELFLLNKGKIVHMLNNFINEKEYEKQILDLLLN